MNPLFNANLHVTHWQTSQLRVFRISYSIALEALTWMNTRSLLTSSIKMEFMKLMLMLHMGIYKQRLPMISSLKNLKLVHWSNQEVLIAGQGNLLFMKVKRMWRLLNTWEYQFQKSILSTFSKFLSPEHTFAELFNNLLTNRNCVLDGISLQHFIHFQDFISQLELTNFNTETTSSGKPWSYDTKSFHIFTLRPTSPLKLEAWCSDHFSMTFPMIHLHIMTFLKILWLEMR